MGMFGKPDSKKANNAWHTDGNIRRWCSIAAALPQNKSDPYYFARTYLHIKKDLVDFHEFIADTAKSVKALSKESQKAMRLSLSRIHVYIDESEVENSMNLAA